MVSMKSFKFYVNFIDAILIKSDPNNRQHRFSSFLLDIVNYTEIENELRRKSYLSEVVSRTAYMQSLLTKAYFEYFDKVSSPVTKTEFSEVLSIIMSMTNLFYFTVDNGPGFHNNYIEIRNLAENLANSFNKLYGKHCTEAMMYAFIRKYA